MSIRYGKQFDCDWLLGFDCDWLLGLTQARLGVSHGQLKPGHSSAHPPLYGCYVKLRLAYETCVWLTGLDKIVLYWV